MNSEMVGARLMFHIPNNPDVCISKNSVVVQVSMEEVARKDPTTTIEDSNDSSDDEDPKLSSATMAALQEFLAEQKGYKEYEASLAKAKEDNNNVVAELKEDWYALQWGLLLLFLLGVFILFTIYFNDSFMLGS